MFRIFLNINSISYSFRSIANKNGVRYSDSTSYFKKYSSSKCKQTVCFIHTDLTHLTSTLICVLHKVYQLMMSVSLVMNDVICFARPIKTWRNPSTCSFEVFEWFEYVEDVELAFVSVFLNSHLHNGQIFEN
jgi:hypothetical protein